MRAPLADADGVAVGRGAREAADADIAAGAGDILDHQRLTERGAHRLGEDARQRVGRAAGGKRRDHGDGPRRIALRLRTADACDERGNGGRHDG
jgi:hypothetical protein